MLLLKYLQLASLQMTAECSQCHPALVANSQFRGSICASYPAAAGTMPGICDNLFDAVDICQRCCLEESGQRLNFVGRTYFVLARNKRFNDLSFLAESFWPTYPCVTFLNSFSTFVRFASLPAQNCPTKNYFPKLKMQQLGIFLVMKKSNFGSFLKVVKNSKLEPIHS